MEMPDRLQWPVQQGDEAVPEMTTTKMHGQVDKAATALKEGRERDALEILIEVVRAIIPYPADYFAPQPALKVTAQTLD